MILAEKIKFNRFMVGMAIKNQKPISPTIHAAVYFSKILSSYNNPSLLLVHLLLLRSISQLELIS
jgi:hypothetical protein